MKKYLFLSIICAFLGTALYSQKKEYLLSWNDTLGMETVSLQRVIIENKTFELNKDKSINKSLRTETIVLESKVHWSIVAEEGKMLVVSILHKDGIIMVKSPSRSRTYRVDNPKEAELAKKDPAVEAYIQDVIGGYAYEVHKETGEVNRTWEMEAVKQKVEDKKQQVTYKRKLLPGKDPKRLSPHYWIIPNKSVPVGYEWNRRTMGEATEDLKFEKVQPYMKRSAVAKIIRNGKLLKNGKEFGKVKGTLYFDLDYRTTLEHKSITQYEQTRTVPGEKNKTRTILEQGKIHTIRELLYTNFEHLKKK